MKRRLLLASALSLIGIVRADITPNPLFCDGAVIQRDTEAPVWGTGTKDGEKVSVSLDGGAPMTTTVAGGKWSVKLPATPGGPKAHTLTLAGDNTVVVKDVLFGEVWICSGQSNMAMNYTNRAYGTKLGAATAARKNTTVPGLRMFHVADAVSAEPRSGVSGKWARSGPPTNAGFSLVGQFFGGDLKKALGDIPVGLIEADWGGTPAQAWTSRAALEQLPAWKPKVAAFDKQLAANPKSLGPNAPSSLRNAMITPLIPYAIRGVIWYQGESNGSSVAAAKDYRTLFPAMIADWRKDWGRGDFPFLFVQIAPFGNQTPEIREAQMMTLKVSPNTAMVQTIDIGDPKNIHPKDKEPVGERLSRAARALAYGEKIEYSGPLFAGAEFTGGKAVVSFTHADAGLVLKNAPAGLFQVAGADKKFHPATAGIEGDKLVVASPEVPAPVAVRYGWSNTPTAALFNKAGLPASPFRSDGE